MEPRSYRSPEAFRTALEQRIRKAVAGGGMNRFRQLLVFDRFLRCDLLLEATWMLWLLRQSSIVAWPVREMNSIPKFQRWARRRWKGSPF